MVDSTDNYKLGEIFPDNRTALVEYTEDVVPGDLLKVVGVQAGGVRLRVAVQTAATTARFIANYAGKAGDLEEVLRSGTTKVTFGTGVTPGESGLPKANKIVAAGTGASGSACAVVISDGNADGDSGLVYFNGAMS